MSMNFIVVIYFAAEEIFQIFFYHPLNSFFSFRSFGRSFVLYFVFSLLFRDFDTFLFYCVKFNKFLLNAVLFPIFCLSLSASLYVSVLLFRSVFVHSWINKSGRWRKIGVATETKQEKIPPLRKKYKNLYINPIYYMDGMLLLLVIANGTFIRNN